MQGTRLINDIICFMLLSYTISDMISYKNMMKKAFLTETPHQLFSTNMLLDRSWPLNSAVLTDQARDLAGAVTFTRSTPGCGTLAGPSLESAGFRSQKTKQYAHSPGLKRPGALQGPRRPGSVLFARYDKPIPGIYLSYVPTQ
jgi:hypothetical protein